MRPPVDLEAALARFDADRRDRKLLQDAERDVFVEVLAEVRTRLELEKTTIKFRDPENGAWVRYELAWADCVYGPLLRAHHIRKPLVVRNGVLLEDPVRSITRGHSRGRKELSLRSFRVEGAADSTPEMRRQAQKCVINEAKTVVAALGAANTDRAVETTQRVATARTVSGL